MQWRCVVSFATLAGCGIDLSLPGEDAAVVCARHADCPQETRCAELVGECFARLESVAPRLVSATAPTATTVVLVFDERLRADSTGDATLYRFTPALAATTPRLGDDGSSISLVTDPQPPGRTYEIDVGAVTDRQGNALDPAHAHAEVITFGDTPDPEPPENLVPADGKTLRSHDITLAWTGRAGALSYTVEVDDEDTFSAPLVAKPPPVMAPATSITVTVPADDIYYWRVRADTTADEPSATSFVALLGPLHVYCPQGETCERGTGAGTAEHPFGTVSWGTVMARFLGADRINIAGRGGDAVYDDWLQVAGVPFNVFGGYDPTFTTRDPDTYPTVIERDNAPASTVSLADPVVLDGLTLRATGVGFTSVAFANLGAEQVELVDCILEITSVPTVAWVVYSSGGGATIRDCHISNRGASLVQTGVRSEGSDVRIEDSTLVTGAQPVLLGPAVEAAEGGTLVVDRSHLYADGVGVATGSDAGAVTVRNSVLVTSASSGQAWGLSLLSPAETRIINNTIVVRGSSEATGIRVTTNPVVANNLIVCLDVSSFRQAGLHESEVLSDPASFQNNTIAGCDTLYRDENTVELTDIADVNALTGDADYGANLASTAAVDDLFVDLDGADDDLTTPHDNDLRLPATAGADAIAAAGKDPTGSDCGAFAAPVACGGTMLDAHGDPRTLPVSIGAYERE